MSAHACYVFAAWGFAGFCLIAIVLQAWLKRKKADA